MLVFRNNEEFCKIVKELIEEEIDCEKYKVLIQEVNECNTGLATGILVIDKSCDNCATKVFEMDKYFKRYKNGEQLRGLVLEIKDSILSESSLTGNLKSFNFVKDFDLVKGNIASCIMGVQGNEDYLKTVPHIKILDIALYYIIVLATDCNSLTKVVITDEILQLWGKSLEDLVEVAVINSPRILPSEIKCVASFTDDMQDNVSEFEDCEEEELIVDTKDMYILSNIYCNNGAGVILYTNLLKGLSDILDDDLVIVPTTIHEVLVMPYSVCKQLDSVLFYEVTKSLLDSQELKDRLTSSIYKYERKENKLSYME